MTTVPGAEDSIVEAAEEDSTEATAAQEAVVFDADANSNDRKAYRNYVFSLKKRI